MTEAWLTSTVSFIVSLEMMPKLMTEATTLDRVMSRMPCTAWELIKLAQVSSGQLPSRAWQMSLSSTDHHVRLSLDHLIYLW